MVVGMLGVGGTVGLVIEVEVVAFVVVFLGGFGAVRWTEVVVTGVVVVDVVVVVVEVVISTISPRMLFSFVVNHIVLNFNSANFTPMIEPFRAKCNFLLILTFKSGNL